LSEYLENYPASFSEDIDEMWTNFDVDKNGFLDREEAKEFVSKLSEIIDEDRG
jgi:hypothetical protein|tara:strand:+ start:580 stop:738 length:159 start_codon:yes stop_codon:yes gene_type:complete